MKLSALLIALTAVSLPWALSPGIGAAAAEDDVPAAAPIAEPAASPPALDPALCRRALIPPTAVWTERQVNVPPQTITRRVPHFETVTVPVMETAQVPEYQEIQVPTYAWRDVPVYEDRRVPVYGPVHVPVYARRSVPVTLSLPNPFGCDDFCIELWDECEEVAVGSTSQTGIVGYETESVLSGTRRERYQSGTETRTVCVGTRPETRQVGEREERRHVGFREEIVVVEPARVDTFRECVQMPERVVTVVPDSAPPSTPPLSGTTEVLTETEYRNALASVPQR
jgi:hypothetical protein